MSTTYPPAHSTAKLCIICADCVLRCGYGERQRGDTETQSVAVDCQNMHTLQAHATSPHPMSAWMDQNNSLLYSLASTPMRSLHVCIQCWRPSRTSRGARGTGRPPRTFRSSITNRFKQAVRERLSTSDRAAHRSLAAQGWPAKGPVCPRRVAHPAVMPATTDNCHQRWVPWRRSGPSRERALMSQTWVARASSLRPYSACARCHRAR